MPAPMTPDDRFRTALEGANLTRMIATVADSPRLMTLADRLTNLAGLIGVETGAPDLAPYRELARTRGRSPDARCPDCGGRLGMSGCVRGDCVMRAKPVTVPADPAVYVPTATAPGVGQVRVTEDDSDDDDTPLVVPAMPTRSVPVAAPDAATVPLVVTGGLEWDDAGQQTRCGRYFLEHSSSGWFWCFCSRPETNIVDFVSEKLYGSPEPAREDCADHHRKAGAK